MVINYAPVPRQFGDESERELVETSAVVTKRVLISAFVLSFILQLIISSAMEHMWVLYSVI